MQKERAGNGIRTRDESLEGSCVTTTPCPRMKDCWKMVSGRPDSNRRLLGPKPSALPSCATPRLDTAKYTPIPGLRSRHRVGDRGHFTIAMQKRDARGAYPKQTSQTQNGKGVTLPYLPNFHIAKPTSVWRIRIAENEFFSRKSCDIASPSAKISGCCQTLHSILSSWRSPR